jgi:urease accessory protein UreF
MLWLSFSFCRGLEIMLEKYEVKDDISMLKFLSDKI